MKTNNVYHADQRLSSGTSLNHLLMLWLGYLGLLPFAGGLVVLATSDQTQVGLIIFTSYSTAIATFLAGTLWQPHAPNPALAITSNLLVLIAVGAFLLSLARPVLGLTLLALCFYGAFFSERFASRSPAYVRMRQRLTGSVILLHACAIYWVMQQ